MKQVKKYVNQHFRVEHKIKSSTLMKCWLHIFFIRFAIEKTLSSTIVESICFFTIFEADLRNEMWYFYINPKCSRRRKRIKRDRSLLAVSGPKYWPRWCHKVAFFRVFQRDFTLCLYKNRFRDDPIVAFSNPTIGTTIYGYWNKKSYQELGKKYKHIK